MRTALNIKKPDTNVGKLELMNALGATLGFAPSADAASFVAQLDEKIDAQKADLAKLAGVRDTVATLLRERRRGPQRQARPGARWSPGTDTLCARVIGLLQQHVILARQEIIDLLAAQAAGAVPPGSISAALSKLAAAGMIEGGRTGWQLSGADSSEAE